MRFDVGIDLFIADQWTSGRITSKRTEVSYRICLEALAHDVQNRDPRTIGREDVKRTLARWPKPNTQRTRRSIMVSFFQWCMEEGVRKDNPALQTRRPKKQPTTVYRMTMGEALAMLEAAHAGVERRIVHIGICAGLRRDELRYLQGRHFRRDGFVWISRDIAKGGRERYIPVIPDLQALVDEIRSTVADEHFVIPAQRWRNPPTNTVKLELHTRPASPQFVWRTVSEVAKRAGISAHIHPHLMRHAFGDHVARHAGLYVAQSLMGHASVDTTASTYVGQPTLDDLLKAVENLSFQLPPSQLPEFPSKAPTGIEPVDSLTRPDSGVSKERP